MRREVVTGEFYRHFKGNVYQVREIAKDCDTQECVVVYQGMYEPYTCWVRKYDEFVSEVDTKKYPDAEQKYRFEKVDFTENTRNNMAEEGKSHVAQKELSNVTVSMQWNANDNEEQNAGDEQKLPCDLSDAEIDKIYLNGQAEKYLSKYMNDDEIGKQGLMQLLDAESFHDKREIFKGLKKYLNERLINNIAVALDIVLEEGTIEMQYDSIMNCLNAFEHYEGGRLR